jgi:hypothetical protein
VKRVLSLENKGNGAAIQQGAAVSSPPQGDLEIALP